MLTFQNKSAILVLILLVGFLRDALAQQDTLSKALSRRPSKFKVGFGGEYLWPVERRRDIQTISFNALAGKEYFRKIHLSPYGGITATYAWGNILQLNDSSLQVRYENAAFGAGPVFILRFEPLVYKSFSLGGDFSTGVIFYSRNFPAGGDFYNFMWRTGPTIAWRISDNYSINAGYRWMHISNGQGLKNRNPYYPAQGVSVNFDRYF